MIWPRYLTSCPRVSDKALEEAGIYPDNVICLKDGADAKRKRVDGEGDICEPPAKRDVVDYERRFDDGGGSQFSGPPMVGGDYEEVPGKTLWYKCTAHKGWFQIPRRYTVIVEGDDQ